ncbi:DUF3613 domain-containing protein [Vibrio cincinnatiensis]|jgi:hypothetical protein|uniref:DUF3613 domain-containing protein n=1 Tax=Vibrio cincinnatiensis TaxID=675 RepID=UPI001EDD1102|nr:DUF3613 domain-containing protein [Vibrio cincinnatiensis]MCG3729783.1 DUF3613 domain-containing protein [Vibrio cincinnatiensis]
MEKTLILLLLIAPWSLSQAAQPKTAAKVSQPDQSETRLWLELQRKNTSATAYDDQLSAEAAKAAQARMVKSFTHEIPEKFIKNKFGE